MCCLTLSQITTPPSFKVSERSTGATKRSKIQIHNCRFHKHRGDSCASGLIHVCVAFLAIRIGWRSIRHSLNLCEHLRHTSSSSSLQLDLALPHFNCAVGNRLKVTAKDRPHTQSTGFAYESNESPERKKWYLHCRSIAWLPAFAFPAKRLKGIWES